MDRTRVRRTLVCSVLVAAGALAGCSTPTSHGSPGSSGSPATSAGRTATAGTDGAEGATPTGSPKGTGTAGGTTHATSAAQARKGMPVVNPPAAGSPQYGTASTADRTRFARVAKAAGGLAVSRSVNSLAVSGSDVGSVAVYRTKNGLAKSAAFQDQFVVQLINALAGSKAKPRFVRAQGQVMAMSTGKVAVVGWFQGDQVTLVYRRAATPDLAGLALDVRAAPPGG